MSENFETSCSIINKGTKAIKIKNGTPYVGHATESKTADNKVSNRYFISEICNFQDKFNLFEWITFVKYDSSAIPTVYFPLRRFYFVSDVFRIRKNHDGR